MGRNLVKRSRFSGFKGMERIGREASAKMKEMKKETSDPELSRGYNSSEIGVKWAVGEDYAFEQLMKGAKIEFEHTNNEVTATTIASQHLYKEGIEYYNELENMEKKLKSGNMSKDSSYVDVKLPDGKWFAGNTDDAANYAHQYYNEPTTKIIPDNDKELAESIMSIDSDAWDKLELESGDQLYSDIELQKKYKKLLDKGNIPAKLSEGVHDILEDQNYHSLNWYNGLTGRYGEATKERYLKSAQENKNALSPQIFLTVEAPKVESKKDPSETPTQINFKNKLERINFIKSLIDQKGEDLMKYSESELKLLRTYEGMGGQSRKVDEINLGLLDQFYTEYSVIEKMWGLAFKYGFDFTGSKKILEPSCGIGRFFEYIPEGHQVVGFEIDKYAYTIVKLTFPRFTIHNEPFETMFWDTQKNIKRAINPYYNLVIGNPPYRDLDSKYTSMQDVMRKTEKDYTHATTFDQYMLRRGIDKLLPGGLLIFVIPNQFLSNNSSYNKFKDALAEQADLIDAYRLPNGIFENTTIGTDIVVFKKK
jgi:type I restriction-modification system DNA methylase subunit